MAKDWSVFEKRARQLVSLFSGVATTQERIAGVNLDCVAKRSSSNWMIAEITKEKNLDKIRGDIHRLSLVRNSLFVEQNIVSECFIIVDYSPTAAMKDAGKAAKVFVVSLPQMERVFFDYPAYVEARKSLQFGSAINPLTGEPDRSEYVPVSYEFDENETDANINDIAKLLRAGKNIVLIGEYGTGKSRCFRELFGHLSNRADDDDPYYLAIDLRQMWGLRSAQEIIRRHMEMLGLTSYSDKLIRAYNVGAVCMMFDGFDEIGSQSWSNNSNKLQSIRYESLAGVREAITGCRGGVIVCGREHYFNSNQEMFYALGMEYKRPVLVKCKAEFSDSEMKEFLRRFSRTVKLPDWLPRRPLMCQAIASLDDEEISRIFGDDDGDVEFWHTFMRVIAERESRIRATLDPDAILLVLQRLARITRSKNSDVGPITLAEIQQAFEHVLGQQPIEEASVMLQRLPGLGRTEAESNDRKFIDSFILDGLRARDLGDGISKSEPAIERDRWINPLGHLGQRVFGRIIEKEIDKKRHMRFAERCIREGNSVAASDIVASILNSSLLEYNFSNFNLYGGHITTLNLADVRPKGLIIDNSIIEEIEFPGESIDGIIIRKCQIGRVHGISGKSGLPAWIDECGIETYELVSTLTGIKSLGLSPPHQILVTILKKTFFQKGAGRQEQSLLRGLGQIDKAGVINDLLRLLVSEGMLRVIKGDHGLIYVPIMTQKSRAAAIMSSLSQSEDRIWKQAGQL